LQAVREAGFTHVHWCHHWNTDFLYHVAELRQIRSWLQVLKIYASAGREKAWGAAEEYRRAAGVALMANVIILHAPTADSFDSQRRSLDELELLCRREGVRIAFENLPYQGTRDGNHALTDDPAGASRRNRHR
jgi:hypothetical protein